MDYRVIISLPALRDLGEIARFIAEGVHGSPAAAEKIGEELIVLSESLATLPHRRRGGSSSVRTAQVVAPLLFDFLPSHRTDPARGNRAHLGWSAKSVGVGPAVSGAARRSSR